MIKKFLYIEKDTEAPLIVWAKHRPSSKNIPRRGTWIVNEWINNSWTMPCFPEITYKTIENDLKFIGRIK